jgi:RNA polymerase sigma factor (sigma-70 family)
LMIEGITQENFDMLLSWLDADGETAGEKYEKIRGRLIRVFAGRGCYEPEKLADETIDRVLQKLPEIRNEYVGDPALYFYKVAHYIHMEWLRRENQGGFVELTEIRAYNDGDESEEEYECLEKCLDELPEKDREMILEYHTYEKKEKIEHRKKIAERLGITVNALQTKVCRIMIRLKECAQK